MKLTPSVVIAGLVVIVAFLALVGVALPAWILWASIGALGVAILL